MDTLVALGTGAAWFYSMLVVILPDWFPMASRHVYFEASAMIIGLLLAVLPAFCFMTKPMLPLFYLPLLPV